MTALSRHTPLQPPLNFEPDKLDDLHAPNDSCPANSSARRIDRSRLDATLRGETCAWNLQVVEQTGSTNADLMARLRAARTAGETDNARGRGEVLLAYVQSAGRGRRGRQWVAAAGDALLFSVALVLPLPVARLGGLSLAIGTAVLAGLRKLPLELPIDQSHRLALKWPNDILLDGAKLGGILLETAWSDLRHSAVVIGIGLNLRGAEALSERLEALSSAPGTAWNRPAALSQVWAEVDMTQSLAQLLNALAVTVDRFVDKGFAPFIERWNADHAYTGRPVVLLDQGTQTAHGTARGVDLNGRLLIDGADGTVAVSSGELSLRLAPPGSHK